MAAFDPIRKFVSVAVADIVEAFNTLINEINERLGSIGQVDAEIAAIAADLDAHEANQSNPHVTTAAQVGSYTIAQVNALIASIGRNDFFLTVAAVNAATIAGSISAIATAGYYVNGDGGGGQYKRGVSAAGAIQSADGTYWQLVVDIANPLQFGALGNGTADDTSKIQAAINYCFGPPGARNNVANNKLNKELFISAGTYRITDSLDCSTIYGFRITGAGRLAANIRQDTANKAVMYCDGMAYGEVRSLSLTNNAVNTTYAPLFLDWTGAFPGTLKPQQLTFADMFFDAGVNGDVGVWIAKSGGAAQCDTIIFDNCFWSSGKERMLSVGFPGTAFNALSIIILGGDFQNGLKHGIANRGGSVFCYGTSFQNFTDGKQSQLRSGGYDLWNELSVGPLTARDIRSEGDCLASGFNLDWCEAYNADINQWAPSVNYVQGNFRTGRLATTAKLDGRLYVCIQAGTSGVDANEPDWANSGGGGLQVLTGVATTAGSTTVTVATSGITSGMGVWIRGAGSVNNDLYTTVASITNSTTLELTNPAVTAVTNSALRAGPLLADNTVMWMQWEYFVVSAGSVTNSKFNYGKISLSRNANASNNVSSRKDMFDTGVYQGLGPGVATGVMLLNNRVRLGNAQAGSATPIDFDVFYNPTNSTRGYLAPIFWSYDGAILFDAGAGTGQLYPSVGLMRGDGAIATAGSATDISRNVVAVLGTIGRKVKTGTDVAGDNTVVQGGLGTGTGAGGYTSIRYQFGTTTGTSVPNSTEVLRVQGTAVAGDTALMLWDVTSNTLRRVTLGAADSGGTGFKALRVPN